MIIVIKNKDRSFFYNFDVIETIVLDGPALKLHIYFPSEGSATFSAKTLDDLVKAENDIEYGLINNCPLVDLSSYLK